MPMTRLSQELKEKPIVSITNGEIIAAVNDLLINPQTREVAALTFSEGGLLNRKVKVIPRSQVHVWGQDVILVSGPDVFAEKDTLPCHDQCLSVGSQIKGREVVGQDGTRIGELNDVLINDQGHLVGYDLSKVNIEGAIAKSKRIPVEATHALGPDVLIVDKSKLEV